MEKEIKSLSDYRTDAWQGRGNIVYPEDKVKEFIKDIMKISEEEDVYRALTREDFIKRFNKRIEERAGKDLI